MVKYVARRLGLHVVEYSCHTLMASSERKISDALAQAFLTARRYHYGVLESCTKYFLQLFKFLNLEGMP